MGFALVTLPLLAGMVNMAYAIGRLAHEGRHAIFITMQVTRSTRELEHGAANFKRAAGQYYVLQDPALKIGVQVAHRAIEQSLASLQSLPFHDKQIGSIRKIDRMGNRLYRVISEHPSGGMNRFDGLLPDFNFLISQAHELADSSNDLVDAQDAKITRQAQLAWNSLLWQAVAVILLSLCFAAFFSWLLARPVKQIDRAIRFLGAGDFQTRTEVQGPVDLVFLGRQIDWLRRRLIELDQQQLRFLRHVSHELKTPLTSLREGVELLADGVGGRLSEEQREITYIMRNNARDLQQRIEDLIKYSRVQRQLDPLISSDVDLAELIGDIVRRNDLGLRAKRLQVDCGGGVPSISADRKKLDTIFENLLINAIRFSPIGTAIRIEMHKSGDVAEVTVADQGPGVSEDDRPYIFKPFYQGKHQPDSTISGNGLGLAIAQEYARLHGGEIKLCDISDCFGACFCVLLPIDIEPRAGFSQDGRPSQSTPKAFR